MANLTRIKILNTASTSSAPTNIYTGEMAYSYVTGTQANNGDRLYIGTGTENPYAPNVDIIGGKYFTEMLNHVHGTTTASSALITDANSHVSALNTAAFKVAGGADITGDLYIGGNLNLGAAVTFSSITSTGLASLDGGINVNDKFEVDGLTGAISLTGDSADFTITNTAVADVFVKVPVGSIFKSK
mgnify:CR=1 FL=1